MITRHSLFKNLWLTILLVRYAKPMLRDNHNATVDIFPSLAPSPDTAHARALLPEVQYTAKNAADVRRTIVAERRNNPHYSEVPTGQTNSSDDTAIAFIKVDAGSTIKLKCHIRNGPYLVLWNRIGLDYPLTIGTHRFVPDERIQVHFWTPDNWQLTITDAQPTDTGVYTCTTSAGSHGHVNESKSSDRPQYHKPVSHNMPSDATESVLPRNQDYYVTVVEQNITDRLQVDAPASAKQPVGSKVLTLTGPKLVFYGTALELLCRVSFPTDDAKLNPHITLEWYHRGVRRRPSANGPHGGVQIIEHWIDSHLLESRLFIGWVTEADAGQWICLERSSLTSENRTGTPVSKTHFRRLNPTVWSSGPRPIQLPPVDLAYDKLELEIVDLPNPTTVISTTITPLPIFPIMNDPGMIAFDRSHFTTTDNHRVPVKRQTQIDYKTSSNRKNGQITVNNNNNNNNSVSSFSGRLSWTVMFLLHFALPTII